MEECRERDRDGGKTEGKGRRRRTQRRESQWEAPASEVFLGLLLPFSLAGLPESRSSGAGLLLLPLLLELLFLSFRLSSPL